MLLPALRRRGPLESRPVPRAEARTRFVGGLEELEQRPPRVGRGAHVVVAVDELLQVRVIEGPDGPDPGFDRLSALQAKRAEGILTAPQLEVFRESQTQQMNMVKMQMEWGAKMFGGDGKD